MSPQTAVYVDCFNPVTTNWPYLSYVSAEMVLQYSHTSDLCLCVLIKIILILNYCFYFLICQFFAVSPVRMIFFPTVLSTAAFNPDTVFRPVTSPKHLVKLNF